MQRSASSPSPARAHAPGAVLACVGHGSGAAGVLAWTASFARAQGAGWHAVLVEDARSRRLGPEARLAALENLRQAQAAGASASVLEGEDAAAIIAGYALRHGCATVVLARAARAPLPWRRPLGQCLAKLAPQLHLVILAPGQRDTADAAPDALSAASATPGRGMLAVVAASLVAALLALPLLPWLDAASAAVLLVPAALLAAGSIAARVMANLRAQAQAASLREARTRALYEFARALSAALQVEQVFEITRGAIEHIFDARSSILLPDAGGRLTLSAPGLHAAARFPVLSVLDMAAAQWAFDNASAAGAGTGTLPSNDHIYLPLVAPMRTRGVLAIRVPQRFALLVPERRALLDAFAALAAIALERVHYVEVAQGAQVAMEGERLRNSLLAALSHDLRTPLTSLVGLSESLALSRPALSGEQMELAALLRDEARRMSTLVANLLDMARIQSGGVKLKLEWQLVEELVGSALRACRWQLGARTVEVRLPRDLPLVRFDAALLERVLCNLLENAGKYTPPGARITIDAGLREGRLWLAVRDDGPGLPPGREDALFEKFARGQNESPIAGVGLGLAICRAIVEAHGGAMRAWNAGGACFELSLPLGEPPPLPAFEPDGLQHHPSHQ